MPAAAQGSGCQGRPDGEKRGLPAQLGSFQKRPSRRHLSISGLEREFTARLFVALFRYSMPRREIRAAFPPDPRGGRRAALSIAQSRLPAAQPPELHRDQPRQEAADLRWVGALAPDHTGHSDIDLAVLLPHAEAKQAGSLSLSEARFQLEEALGRQIDLVNARVSPIVLQKEIIGGGTCLFADDSSRVEAYEMLVLSLYGRLNEERRGILEEFYASGKAFRV
jgi:predicted nucleotidyltransferase